MNGDSSWSLRMLTGDIIESKEQVTFSSFRKIRLLVQMPPAESLHCSNPFEKHAIAFLKFLASRSSTPFWFQRAANAMCLLMVSGERILRILMFVS